MQKQTQLLKSQEGFASLVIGLIIIIVLALLTVGFAQLARREQQNSLDKQLATQAADAAESGINAAYKDITSGVLTNALGNTSPTTCMTKTGSSSGTGASGHGIPVTAATANQSIGSPSDGISYTCLLVDLQPPSIEFSNLNPGEAQHLTFSTAPIADSLTINWGSADGKTSYLPTSGANFPPYDTWKNSNHPAVLQLTLTPIDQLNRNSLISNTFTAYLYPSTNSQVSQAFRPGSVPIVPGACSGSGQYTCKATISGLTASSYLVHILDFYDSSNILINGTNSGTAVKFTDGQAQIDVTGKAKNVLKRLQVRVPIHPTAPLPSYAVEGQDICKRIQADQVTSATSVPPPGSPAGTCLP